ncbi:hypothetical protein [Brachybacterium saurashtrense]|uniref:FUSC family protein n=1 Tax=Brachybacterium saurashtrense TaxID=556288 RepID=A0A345YKG8_9MICO|nr:hypothetical protein [Brachybacterium saurashtrense]AXK44420.1 hypothetical protein DWV08_01475 [Brachybacterium saurashtrense]RRR23032.1 hypothetical protein DXU92_06605 [Brachybacterium saurashtrense]
MRTPDLLDPIARRLLALRTVGRSQWLLRGLGTGATLLALVLTVGPTALLAHSGAVLLALVVGVGLLAQCLRPDTDLGLVPPVALLIALVAQGDTPMLRAGGIGLALLLGHAAFALAATIPVHGELAPSAWRLAARGLVPVLALSAVAAGLVVLLSGVHLGAWMMVIGVLAAIVLFLTVLPRQR